MAAVIEGVGACAHCGAACDTHDAEGVWHCGVEHLLLARLGVPPVARPAAHPRPRRPAAPPDDRYASLRATLAQQTAGQRHAAVLRAAGRRVRLLREHLEAGLDMLAGSRREERVVRSVLVHPEVREALVDTLATLRCPLPTVGTAQPAPPGPDPHVQALADVRELEAALAVAAGGHREGWTRSRRAALALLTYVDARLRPSGRRRVAA